MTDPTYCRWCGRTDCAGACANALEAPAFCPRCGRRLVVNVRPLGYRARCPVDGPLAG